MLCYVSHRSTRYPRDLASTTQLVRLWLGQHGDPITQTFARNAAGAKAAYGSVTLGSPINQIAVTIVQLERVP